MNLNVTRVPLSTLAAFLVAVGSHPHSDEEVIASFAGGLSKATAKRALPSLMELGLISKDINGRYVCNTPEVKRGMKDAEAFAVIKRSLHNFRPFEAICEGIALNEGEAEVLRRAALIVGVTGDEKLKVLVGWGEELGILTRDTGSLLLAPELVAKVARSGGSLSTAQITSEAAARLFNAKRLGRDANHFLDKQDRTLLAQAQLAIKADPEDAVEKSGKALEDYLRELAGRKSLSAEAKTCNGAGQLGSMLVNQNIIHSHHNQLIGAISTVRNMKAHHKDKKTLKPWHVTEAGAEWAVLGTLQIIRSVHEFVFKGDQIL